MAIGTQIIIQDTYDCDPSVAVNDLVYIASDGLLKKAQSNSRATMPAVGIVTKKVDVGRCRITNFKLLGDLTGILNKKSYYVSETAPGGFQDNCPRNNGSVRQRIGEGMSSDLLKISIADDFTLMRGGVAASLVAGELKFIADEPGPQGNTIQITIDPRPTIQNAPLSILYIEGQGFFLYLEKINYNIATSNQMLVEALYDYFELNPAVPKLKVLIDRGANLHPVLAVLNAVNLQGGSY